MLSYIFYMLADLELLSYVIWILASLPFLDPIIKDDEIIQYKDENGNIV